MITRSSPIDKAPELCRLDASMLSTLYSTGELSPVEVTQACLEQAERVQSELNAFSFIDTDGAILAAQASEERWRKGEPLSESDGIPTTIKDLVWVKDWVVRFGSRITPDSSTVQDAPSVALLRNAGTVFIGQTTSPEFGWKPVTDSPLRGVTRNPWDPTKTPGGSSGGAAVAAATGVGVFHLGTDGGGSIRVPASFTGMVGLKATFGRVPNFPPSGFYSVSHTGPITRTTDDAVRMLRAMSGRDVRDWSQCFSALPDAKIASLDLRTLKIGYWAEPPVGSTEPEVRHAVENALMLLSDHGSAIEPFKLPDEDVFDLFTQHWLSGAALRTSTISPENRKLLDSGFLAAAELGARIPATSLLQAQVRRAHFGAAMDMCLEDLHFIISPAVAVAPFEVEHTVPPRSSATQWTEWASFSFPLNLSGHPACTVPCGFTSTGLPVGLQIIGRRGCDAEVLSLARALELLSRSAR